VSKISLLWGGNLTSNHDFCDQGAPKFVTPCVASLAGCDNLEYLSKKVLGGCPEPIPPGHAIGTQALLGPGKKADLQGSQ
jgi:hypothetical protein